MFEELNEKEKNLMDHLVTITKPKIHLINTTLIACTILLFGFISWLVYQYWTGKYGQISHVTSLILGGQLVALYGASVTAVGASYKTKRAALMSITKRDSNPVLFYELIKTKIFTQWGFYILGIGFLIQAISMILNESIGL